MAPIRLNFTNIATIDPVPTGIYGVSIASWELAEGPSGPYIKWTFNVSQPVEFENRKLFMNTSLSEKARFKVQELLLACGIPEEALKPADGSDIEFDPEEMVGVTLRLSVLQKSVEGRLLNDVVQCLPLSTEAPVKETVSATPTTPTPATPAKSLLAKKKIVG